MSASRRARRMDKNHKRKKRIVSVNLVSLMDIFTILVFFLLVSSSDTESMPSAKVLKLPESIAEQQPKQTLIVMITDDYIIVQGRKVGEVADIIDSPSGIIEGLKKELDYQASRSRKTITNDGLGREITIMGDKKIPYKLLKKIMVTCVSAKYTNLSLAVVQKTAGKG